MRDVKVMRVCNKYAIMLTDEEQKQKQKKQNKLKKRNIESREQEKFDKQVLFRHNPGRNVGEFIFVLSFKSSNIVSV